MQIVCVRIYKEEPFIYDSELQIRKKRINGRYAVVYCSLREVNYIDYLGMSKMRKSLFKWHSYGALIALIPLFIISITGSILVFKVEIDTLLMPDKMLVSADSPNQRLPLDTLTAEIKKQFPRYEIGTWEIFDEHTRTDTAYIIEQNSNNWFKVYLNQYTGEILSTPVGLSENITDWLLDLHYKLLLETKGMFVGAIVSVILLFLGISGIVLYRKFWSNFFTLRLKKARRIFFSDLHKMVGIASSPVIIILAFTGAYWNIAEVIHEVSDHIIEEPYLIKSALYSPSLSLDQLHSQTKNHLESFEATYLVLPYKPAMNITFYGKVASGNPLTSNYASTISYDKNSGALINTQDVRSANALHVSVDSFRKLHFGHFAGLTSQVIWCLLGLSPVILAFTGLYLYWFRNRKNKILQKQFTSKRGAANFS